MEKAHTKKACQDALVDSVVAVADKPDECLVGTVNVIVVFGLVDDEKKHEMTVMRIPSFHGLALGVEVVVDLGRKNDAVDDTEEPLVAAVVAVTEAVEFPSVDDNDPASAVVESSLSEPVVVAAAVVKFHAVVVFEFLVHALAAAGVRVVGVIVAV